MVCPMAAALVDNGSVLMLITLVVIPIAGVAFARAGAAWRGIGNSGRFTIDPDMPQRRPLELISPVDPAVQEAEARQMIEAKAYRRKRRGEDPIDIESEVRRALDLAPERPTLSEELRGEVRQMVEARNERRMRRGQEPLDVEAEIERQVADLIGLGE
jgi:hypothetical protein